MIQIKNIFYMLSYAFKILQEREYKNIEVEEFSNAADLCAAILAKTVSIQVKRGLNKEYVQETEALSMVRGKLNINESIRQQTIIKNQMVCDYDEFSVNSYLNKIIKTTIVLLVKADISIERKKKLKRVLLYFKDVEILDYRRINWNIRFNKTNKTYIMLINVCYLVVKGLIQTETKGNIKMLDVFDEERMHRLYEKFLLEFYRKELSNNIVVSSPHIKWIVDDGYNDMLPIMKADIVLESSNKTLIIDAKYYSRTTQQQYDKHTLHSNNLYQIFAYVKNKELEYGKDHEVSGMLLYAKTDEQIVPDNDYMMSGNRISAKNVDLNCDFKDIKEKLLQLVAKWQGYNK